MPKYLFVSDRCNHCEEFIQLCQENSDLCEDIQLVSIEENKRNLPAFLTKVPTLETPDRVFHGQEVFSWLEELKNAKIYTEEVRPADDFSRSFSSFKDDNASMQISNKFSGIGEPQGSEGVSEENFVEGANNNINLDRLTQQRKVDLETFTNNK